MDNATIKKNLASLAEKAEAQASQPNIGSGSASYLRNLAQRYRDAAQEQDQSPVTPTIQ